MRFRSRVFAAERIHADDATVPVLAKGKTRTGRLWTCVRDDRPFAAGSDEGGRRAVAIYTLVATAKLNDIDPQAEPRLGRISAVSHPLKMA